MKRGFLYKYTQNILLTLLEKSVVDKSPGSSRRSSLYPTTSRRCSEAVAAYAASGDLEAVAEILRRDKDQVYFSLIRMMIFFIYKSHKTFYQYFGKMLMIQHKYYQ